MSEISNKIENVGKPNRMHTVELQLNDSIYRAGCVCFYSSLQSIWIDRVLVLVFRFCWKFDTVTKCGILETVNRIIRIQRCILCNLFNRGQSIWKLSYCSDKMCARIFYNVDEMEMTATLYDIRIENSVMLL